MIRQPCAKDEVRHLRPAHFPHDRLHNWRCRGHLVSKEIASFVEAQQNLEAIGSSLQVWAQPRRRRRRCLNQASSAEATAAARRHLAITHKLERRPGGGFQLGRPKGGKQRVVTANVAAATAVAFAAATAAAVTAANTVVAGL